MTDEVFTNLYAVAVGTTSSNPFIVHFETRAPTPQDVNYPIQKIWVDTVAATAYILTSLPVISSVQSAVWLLLTNGISPIVATMYNGNAGTAIPAANILNVLGGAGINIVGAGNTLTVSATVPPALFTWQTISASQALVKENGYFCTGGGALSLSLPAVSAIGDTIVVTLDGSASFTITQPNVGSQIRFGNQQTTAGITGSLTTTDQGNTLEIVCQSANSKWNVIDSMGNLLWT